MGTNLNHDAWSYESLAQRKVIIDLLYKISPYVTVIRVDFSLDGIPPIFTEFSILSWVLVVYKESSFSFNLFLNIQIGWAAPC